MLRVLAFFGADVERERLSLLREMFESGYTLLALDASAIGAAASANIPFTLIDDWIDSEGILKAREKAAQCERKWFEVARDEFTSEGICWPEFDRHAMHWFWANVTLASVFAERFRMCGGQELRFFQNEIPRPAVYYSPSDVISAFWEVELCGNGKAFERPRKRMWHRMLSYAWSEIRHVGKSVCRWSTIESEASKNSCRQSWLPPSLSVLTGKIVLAFNSGEFYRFTPIIQQLSERSREMVAGVLLSPDQATSTEIASNWAIPILTGPSPAPTGPGLQQKFLRGYAKALYAVIGDPWQKALEHLQFHFEYYSKERWPRLVSTFRSWAELWSRARPKAVIVSSLQDSESQMPAEAAKRFGIRTLAIPHGAGMGRSWNLVSSDYILYSLLTQKAVFERSGIPSGRLIGCRDLVAQNEYPVVPKNRSKTQPSWHVLALTDPIGLSGNLAPHTSPRAQLAALKALDSPPSDVAKQLSLKIKVHPEWSDLELFASMSSRLERLVLPPDCELRSVLRDTALVLAVNYCGAALVHVVREGKPVIFFWLDDLIGRSDPHLYADVFLPAGILVRNRKELWDCVRAFFTDREFADQMRLRAHEYCRKNLEDKNFPSISEVLEKILQDT